MQAKTYMKQPHTNPIPHDSRKSTYKKNPIPEPIKSKNYNERQNNTNETETRSKSRYYRWKNKKFRNKKLSSIRSDKDKAKDTH